MSSQKTRVCIVQPADPCGTVPGGIDTFIRGEIDNAPDDIEYTVVGISTDTEARPIGEWTTCHLQQKSFQFFPVVSHEYTSKARRMPVIVRYLMALGKIARSIPADVLEIHRIETLLRFRSDSRPKTGVLHQNMQSLYDKQADILWARSPRAYFWLEDRLMPQLDTAFCVRSDAANHYRSRYSNLANACHFQPTWADPQQFSAPTDTQRKDSREKICADLGLNPEDKFLLSVGRLDAQKNPLLLIAALKLLADDRHENFQMIMIGEGPLRDSMTDAIDAAGLTDRFHLLGAKSIDVVSEYLHGVDLFVMSSAYEGMPMAVIEALASGVPVATTQVGEVARVVTDKICGRIAEEHSAEAVAEGIVWCLQNLDEISGAPCTQSASNFSPATVLAPVYENYRRLANNASR